MPGVRAPFASSDRLPAPVAGISFYGEGWSKGSCGITLATIKPEHDGTFECTLSVKGQSYKGSIEIMVQGEGLGVHFFARSVYEDDEVWFSLFTKQSLQNLQ